MKKRFLSLALSTAFGMGVAFAAPQTQDQPAEPQSSQAPHGHRRMDPNRQVQMLTKRLNLTTDQQNQVLPILTDQQQQMQSILNDSSLSAKDRHAKMRAVREDSQTKIKAVLNDNQKQTWDQMQQQRRERMQQWREKHSSSDKGTGSQS